MTGDGQTTRAPDVSAWTAPGPPPAPSAGPIWGDRFGDPRAHRSTPAPAPTSTPGTFTFRPGVVTLRPLSLPDLLDGSVRTMRRRPGVFLGAGAAVVALSTLLRTLIDAGIGITLIDADGSPTLTMSPSLAVLPIVGALLAGLLALPTGQAVLGDRAEGGGWLRPLRARAGPLAAYVALVACACAIPAGLVWAGLGGRAARPVDVAAALIALGVVVEFARIPFVAAPAAIVLERAGVRTAVRRSWALVRGSYLRALGVSLVGRLLTLLVQAALVVPLLIAGAALGALTGAHAQSAAEAGAVAALYGMLSACLTLPYEATLRNLLYVDLRARSEGLDVRLADPRALAVDSSRPLTSPTRTSPTPTFSTRTSGQNTLRPWAGNDRADQGSPDRFPPVGGNGGARTEGPPGERGPR